VQSTWGGMCQRRKAGTYARAGREEAKAKAMRKTPTHTKAHKAAGRRGRASITHALHCCQMW